MDCIVCMCVKLKRFDKHFISVGLLNGLRASRCNNSQANEPTKFLPTLQTNHFSLHILREQLTRTMTRKFLFFAFVPFLSHIDRMAWQNGGHNFSISYYIFDIFGWSIYSTQHLIVAKNYFLFVQRPNFDFRCSDALEQTINFGFWIFDSYRFTLTLTSIVFVQSVGQFGGLVLFVFSATDNNKTNSIFTCSSNASVKLMQRKSEKNQERESRSREWMQIYVHEEISLIPLATIRRQKKKTIAKFTNLRQRDLQACARVIVPRNGSFPRNSAFIRKRGRTRVREKTFFKRKKNVRHIVVHWRDIYDWIWACLN